MVQNKRITKEAYQKNPAPVNEVGEGQIDGLSGNFGHKRDVHKGDLPTTEKQLDDITVSSETGPAEFQLDKKIKDGLSNRFERLEQNDIPLPEADSRLQTKRANEEHKADRQVQERQLEGRDHGFDFTRKTDERADGSLPTTEKQFEGKDRLGVAIDEIGEGQLKEHRQGDEYSDVTRNIGAGAKGFKKEATTQNFVDSFINGLSDTVIKYELTPQQVIAAAKQIVTKYFPNDIAEAVAERRASISETSQRTMQRIAQFHDMQSEMPDVEIEQALFDDTALSLAGFDDNIEYEAIKVLKEITDQAGQAGAAITEAVGQKLQQLQDINDGKEKVVTQSTKRRTLVADILGNRTAWSTKTQSGDRHNVEMTIDEVTQFANSIGEAGDFDKQVKSYIKNFLKIDGSKDVNLANLVVDKSTGLITCEVSVGGVTTTEEHKQINDMPKADQIGMESPGTPEMTPEQGGSEGETQVGDSQGVEAALPAIAEKINIIKKKAKAQRLQRIAQNPNGTTLPPPADTMAPPAPGADMGGGVNALATPTPEAEGDLGEFDDLDQPDSDGDQFPGKYCQVCGSDGLTNMDGRVKCNDCGAEYELTVDMTLLNPEKWIGGADEGGDEDEDDFGTEGEEIDEQLNQPASVPAAAPGPASMTPPNPPEGGDMMAQMSAHPTMFVMGSQRGRPARISEPTEPGHRCMACASSLVYMKKNKAVCADCGRHMDIKIARNEDDPGVIDVTWKLSKTRTNLTKKARAQLIDKIKESYAMVRQASSKNEPKADWTDKDNWQACMDDVVANGYDQRSAARIAGAFKAAWEQLQKEAQALPRGEEDDMPELVTNDEGGINDPLSGESPSDALDNKEDDLESIPDIEEIGVIEEEEPIDEIGGEEDFVEEEEDFGEEGLGEELEVGMEEPSQPETTLDAQVGDLHVSITQCPDCKSDEFVSDSEGGTCSNCGREYTITLSVGGDTGGEDVLEEIGEEVGEIEEVFEGAEEPEEALEEVDEEVSEIEDELGSVDDFGGEEETDEVDDDDEEEDEEETDGFEEASAGETEEAEEEDEVAKTATYTSMLRENRLNKAGGLGGANLDLNAVAKKLGMTKKAIRASADDQPHPYFKKSPNVTMAHTPNLLANIRVADRQTMPLDVEDDVDAGVPRDETVGLKQTEPKDTAKIIDDDHGKKRGGEKGSHGTTDVVPRDKSGDGVGGDKVTFEDEKAEGQTSGKPDTYVQNTQEVIKPTPAGNKENRAVAPTSGKGKGGKTPSGAGQSVKPTPAGNAENRASSGPNTSSTKTNVKTARNFDGTGPDGDGPGTGRGKGFCTDEEKDDEYKVKQKAKKVKVQIPKPSKEGDEYDGKDGWAVAKTTLPIVTASGATLTSSTIATDKKGDRYIVATYSDGTKGKMLVAKKKDKKDPDDDGSGCGSGKKKASTQQQMKKAQVSGQSSMPKDVEKDVNAGVPRNEGVGLSQVPANKPVTAVTPGNAPELAVGYERGDGGGSKTPNRVPRDGSGDGLGGKKVTFENEKANEATSGSPDTYVQDVQPVIKPTPAGNANNHATPGGINTASGQSKTIEANTAKKTSEKQLDSRIIKERVKAATKVAVLEREIDPASFDEESFDKRIDEIAEMPTPAIKQLEAALTTLQTRYAGSKSASISEKVQGLFAQASGGLQSIDAVQGAPSENLHDFQSNPRVKGPGENRADQLKAAINQNTTLGRMYGTQEN